MAVHNPAFSPSTQVLFVDGAYPGVSTGSQLQPYTLIQDAIDASGAGDEIQVAPGTYVEDLAIAAGVDVNIVAPGGALVQGACVITDATVTLTGLTMEDDGVAGTDAIHWTGTAADTLTLLNCDIGSTAAGLAAISADNTAGTIVAKDTTIRADVANANQAFQLESGSVDCRDCDILHGSNVAEAFVAEGDAASASILFVDCRFAGSVNAEDAVVAPTSFTLEGCNITVGAISGLIIGATCTVDVDGLTITSTDAGNDAVDGTAGAAMVVGKEIVYTSTADEVNANVTQTRRLTEDEQVGKYTEAAGAGVRAITLPQPYPDANYVVHVTYEDTGAGVQASSNEVDTLTATGFNMTTQVNGVYHWRTKRSA